jgi:acetyl-CoA C-acetyltransferase
MQAVYIVGFKRTPVGAFMGALASVPATELGATALKAALADAGVAPQQVNELYVGNVLSANMGQAPATQVALKAGLPDTTPCTLVNKVCASGTKAVMLAAQTLRLGEAEIIATVGMESMSNVPFYVPNHREGFKYGNQTLLDGIVRDGLQDVYTNVMMGEAGEQTANKYGIGRAAQDAYAVRSYERAIAAQKAGKLAQQIVPVALQTRKGEVLISDDEEPGRVQFDKIATLKPAFRKEGTVTAANASKLNDGAASVILASEAAVKKYNLKPLAKVVSWADASRAPMEFTVAPADALPIALQRANLSIGQLSVVEINEAFSVVALANQQLLGIADEALNPNGGGVSLGHPLGCSGARIIGAAMLELKATGKQYGAVGICNGGGGASALVIENV